MTTPFEISHRFTDEWADSSPILATIAGVTGRNHLCSDYSPEGHAKRADLHRSTRDELRPHLEDPDATQAFAANVMTGWLDSRIHNYDTAKWARDLNHIYSPFQNMRDVFDVMPRERGEDWDSICARLEGFKSMLDGYRDSLAVGLDAGDTVAVRQAESLLRQVEAVASDDSRFLVFVDEAATAGGDVERVTAAVDAARAGCHDFAGWLGDQYLPAADPRDAVGEERYLEGTDFFLGMHVDPDETYD